MSWRRITGLSFVILTFVSGTAHAQIRITEWMYNGLGAGNIGEFVELTNLGGGAVDMTGWSFDDNSRTPGSESLTGLGIVQPGQSVIFTDNTAAAFRTNWNLSASIVVLGGNTNNLGRSDEINIYDAANALVDRLTYNDEADSPGIIPRTNGPTGIPESLAAIGANNHILWQAATVGDAFGSYAAVAGEVGNPGSFNIPEPSCVVLLILGVLTAISIRRR